MGSLYVKAADAPLCYQDMFVSKEFTEMLYDNEQLHLRKQQQS